jgi:hypothetical protein
VLHRERRALADLIPFEFSRTCHHRQEEPAHGARRVDGLPTEIDEVQRDAISIPALHN